MNTSNASIQAAVLAKPNFIQFQAEVSGGVTGYSRSGAYGSIVGTNEHFSDRRVALIDTLSGNFRVQFSDASDHTQLDRYWISGFRITGPSGYDETIRLSDIETVTGIGNAASPEAGVIFNFNYGTPFVDGAVYTVECLPYRGLLETSLLVATSGSVRGASFYSPAYGAYATDVTTFSTNPVRMRERRSTAPPFTLDSYGDQLQWCRFGGGIFRLGLGTNQGRNRLEDDWEWTSVTVNGNVFLRSEATSYGTSTAWYQWNWSGASDPFSADGQYDWVFID